MHNWAVVRGNEVNGADHFILEILVVRWRGRPITLCKHPVVDKITLSSVCMRGIAFIKSLQLIILYKPLSVAKVSLKL